MEFNPAEVSLSDIQQRVEKLGYQAVSKQETLDQEGHRKEAITKQKQEAPVGDSVAAALGHGEPFLLHLLDLDAGPVHEPLVPADPGHTGTVFIGKQFYVGAYKALRNKKRQYGRSGRTRYLSDLFLQFVFNDRLGRRRSKCTPWA